MNLRVILIPKPVKRLWCSFTEIHEKGNTIILVTHEEYIAEHAPRIIRLKDGLG